MDTTIQPKLVKNPKIGLVAVCLAYFMVMIDVNAVSVAAPFLQADLNAGTSTVAWIVDGYTLALAALLLLGGLLSERIGLRRGFLLGVAIFGLASLAAGLSLNAEMLIVFRILQGVGAAIMVPGSLAVLRGMFTTVESRAKAFGAWAAVAAVGVAAGAVLGGLLVGAVGWRSIFLINIPIVIIAVVLTLIYVPDFDKVKISLALPRQIALAVGLTGLLVALNEAGSIGWTAPLVIGGLIVAVVAIGWFFIADRRAETPLIPVEITHGTALRALIVAAVFNMSYYGLLLCTTLYLADLGNSPETIAFVILPGAVTAMISSNVAGRIVPRFGAHKVMLVAAAIGVVAAAGWFFVAGSATLVLVGGIFAIFGVGGSAVVTASTTEVVESAPAHRASTASAVLNMARQTAGAVGVALFVSLFTASTSMVVGMQIVAVIAAVSLIATILINVTTHRRQQAAAAV